jgi:hypothetical protein
MVDESSSLDGPVGDPFSFEFMSNEESSLFRAVGFRSKAVWTVTSIRLSVVGVASVCLVLANMSLLTWTF